ncbi:MAG: PD-(D/E)XK nuclease family protein [Pirellulales bacterium]|nr:PD-(D/E)XK nuclease family protein [Pirellulales bacterium]
MPSLKNVELWIAPARSGTTSAALAQYCRVLARRPVLQRRRALWLAPTFAAAAGIRERLVDLTGSGCFSDRGGSAGDEQTVAGGSRSVGGAAGSGFFSDWGDSTSGEQPVAQASRPLGGGPGRDSLATGEIPRHPSDQSLKHPDPVGAPVAKASRPPWGGALVDPGVTTFAGFAEQVVWDAELRVRTLSPPQRRRLLRRAIAEASAAGALKFFRGAAGSLGLVSELSETIAQLKRQQVSAEAFQRQTRRAPPRRRELADLYRRYEALLQRAVAVDAEGLLLAAIDGMRSNRAVGSKLELVVVDGFNDFSPLQHALLALVAERTERVVVALLGDRRPPSAQASPRVARNELFAIPAATAQLFEEGGAVIRPARAGHELRESTPGDRGAGMPASLEHLQRNIFRNYRDVEPVTAPVQQSLDRVHIVAASGVQAEIAEIARRVKRLLVEGEPPGEVVVVFPRSQDVADRVRQVFDDFGVPSYLDAWPRLDAAPAVRSLLNLLRLHAEDWPYRRLMRVIGDRAVRIEAASPGRRSWPAGMEPSPEIRSAAELCVRHAQLPSGRDELRNLVESWAAGAGGATPVDPVAARAASAALARIAAWFDQWPKQAEVGEWIGVVERMAAAAGLFDEMHARRTGAPAAPPRAKAGAVGQDATNVYAREEAEPAVACAALFAALREVAVVERRLGGEETRLAYPAFLDLAATVAAESSLPPPHDAVGRVRVLSADAARFVRARRLFIGGLSEQAFPMGEPRPDAQGDAADEVNGRRPQETASVGDAQPHSEGMLLFYQLVTRPTESLTLSYPALDAKAQAMPPSPLVLELERAFAGGRLERTVQSLSRTDDLADPPLSRSDLRHSAVARAQQRDRKLLAALVGSPRYGDVGRSILDGMAVIADRAERGRFGAFDGVFGSDAVQAILERRFGPGFVWSPSLLETYAGCPFQFLARHVLRLAPPPELALESDPARRGSLLHDTLARLYGRLAAAAGDAGEAMSPEKVAAEFQRTLDAVVHARPHRGLQGALREIERRQIASWAAQFAQQHHDYAAAWQGLDAPPAARYFEARFGPKSRASESADDSRLSTDAPFELLIDGQTLRLAGQIDRIDVGRVGETTVFNVIDYKTSASAKVNRQSIEAGTQLQLPLYALAVAELLLADQQAQPLAAGYWSVRGKGFNLGAHSGGPLLIGEINDGCVQLAAGWTKLRQTLLARIGEIVVGIRRGAFPVYSADKNCTQFCEFSTACRIAHVRSLDKTWPAQQVAAGESGR